jgi:hypothetical protein
VIGVVVEFYVLRIVTPTTKLFFMKKIIFALPLLIAVLTGCYRNPGRNAMPTPPPIDRTYEQIVRTGILMNFDQEYPFYDDDIKSDTVRGYLTFHADTTYTERSIDGTITIKKQRFRVEESDQPYMNMYVDSTKLDSTTLHKMNKLPLSSYMFKGMYIGWTGGSGESFTRITPLHGAPGKRYQISRY